MGMSGVKNQNGQNIKDGISSFEELFRLYYPRMHRYCMHFLHDEEEANDLVQDIFVQLWDEKEKLDESKNLESYFFTLLRNKCLNLLKRKVVEGKYIRRQIMPEAERLYQLSFSSAAESQSLADRLSMELESLIASMPSQCGKVFQLRWIDGKKIREIAEDLNISTTMVDKHLAKGIEIARKKFPPEFLLLLAIFF